MLTHEAFLKGAILQVTNEISLALACCTRASPPLTVGCSIGCTVRRRGVVGRRWLQSDRRIWIQMADDSLQRRRNARLYLLVHGGRALPTRASRSLGVQVLRLVVLALLLLWLCHAHRLIVSGLCWVRWRSALMVRCVDVVIHIGRWCVRCLRRVLIHLHVGVRGVLCSLLGLLLLGLLLCYSGLLCLGTLFAHSFVALLLLDTWSRRSVRPRTHSGRGHKRSRKLLLCDERVLFGLVRRPSLQWIQVQQSGSKINKRKTVLHFFAQSAVWFIRRFGFSYLAQSHWVSCSSVA